MCEIIEELCSQEREEGREEGIASLIITMYNNGLTPEQIAKMTSKSIEDINVILSNKTDIC